jgi:prophage regulatory protein
MNAQNQLLTLTQVLVRCQLSRSTWYRMAQLKQTPKPVTLGRKVQRWRGEDVERWLEKLVRA